MTETTWDRDVRLGWLVADEPDDDGRFYAVRNRDGKVLEARDRLTLLHGMAVADIVATYREAFADES